VSIVVSCSRGFNFASRSLLRSHAGLYRLPLTAHADSCDVFASASGRGSVRVEVRSA
jgi:hypothetical protein